MLIKFLQPTSEVTHDIHIIIDLMSDEDIISRIYNNILSVWNSVIGSEHNFT